MEEQLEKVLSEIVTQHDTVGALLANRQGLCLGAKGNINPNVSGIGMAISEQVAKLEPNNTVPATICLYSGNKRCVIQKDGEITGIIYKQTATTSTSATN
ncbi:ragulator complex protein LAMTOR5 homolog [Drosophila grimshawi]|uniref:Late endosomal/lysosomal adaptor and MAPK and MTOR activator 5 n=1 Tax=Drosophila grimshawi TaxID=7222 RepID=B4JWZ2_DROGR|nr:ragulator complex protein LAMTOR5 homolog [Drosophila grimshawi]EDV95268.1 GH17852 [Drosophila grimshawi]